MDGDLEYQVMELAASRRLGQLSDKELMVELQELLAAHGDEPAEAEAAVRRAFEENLLTRGEAEILLGPIQRNSTPPMERWLRAARRPRNPPTDPHAAKRWGL